MLKECLNQNKGRTSVVALGSMLFCYNFSVLVKDTARVDDQDKV